MRRKKASDVAWFIQRIHSLQHLGHKGCQSAVVQHTIRHRLDSFCGPLPVHPMLDFSPGQATPVQHSRHPDLFGRRNGPNGLAIDMAPGFKQNGRLTEHHRFSQSALLSPPCLEIQSNHGVDEPIQSGQGICIRKNKVGQSLAVQGSILMKHATPETSGHFIGQRGMSVIQRLGRDIRVIDREAQHAQDRGHCGFS